MNGNGRQNEQRGNGHAARMAEIALRGTALLWDLQADTARNLFEMQARSATMFGAPDLTQMFPVGNGRAKGVFSATVEQAINSMRQINDTVTEVQSQIARVAERQAAGIAEQVQHGIEELGRRSEQGLEEIRRLAQEEVDELERAAREAQSAARSGESEDGPNSERQRQAEGRKRRPHANA